jgi:hypothetical protein
MNEFYFFLEIVIKNAYNYLVRCDFLFKKIKIFKISK